MLNMGTVYFINGFLEAGKTTFIQNLLSQDYFQISGKTLIILCEEGDLEYDDDMLVSHNAVLEIIDKEEDFNEEYLAEIEKKHLPERIFVEYNGMWDRKKLEFPWYWEDIMEIAVIDASTFKLYADNMRSLLAEQVRKAELVIFYKADEVRDKLASYARNIKAINVGAAFVFRGAEGDIILKPEENLPYDINREELELDEVGFAVMCMDSLERYDAYEGKKVHFTARAYRMKDGGDLEFVAGSFIMTCCESDMTFMGILCGYEKAYELENKEWVEITGIIRSFYDEELKRKLPICRVTELKKGITPEKEFVTLV